MLTKNWGTLFIPDKNNDYRPKFLQSKILVYCVVALFIIKIATIGVSINFPQNIFFADITKSSLEKFVNQGREALGLSPLIENHKLNEAAMLKAQDMMQKGYFSHQSPDGVTPWFWFNAAGYNYNYAGENLAIGFIDSKEVYNAWYNSISHRENILNPNYKEIGTAILEGFGENKATIVVQLFGSTTPIKASAKTLNEASKNTTHENTEEAQKLDNQFVLSQSTQAETKNNFYLKYLNLLTYNYERILQNIIYGFMIAIGTALLLNIFINFEIQRKDLLLRAVIIMVLLFLTTLINKDIIVQIIPHKILI